MFIGYDEETPIGQIRVDIQDEVGIISFSVAQEYRGLGYGSKLLKSLKKELLNTKVTRLLGQVKYDNLASQHVFEKAGFSKAQLDDYIEYSISLMNE
jgi:spore coat polysaccharide biosynthesis protein SpsF